MEPDKSSPLPWHLDPELDRFTDWPILDANDEPVVTTDNGVYGPSNADAALIVEAVNNYNRLRRENESLKQQLSRARERGVANV